MDLILCHQTADFDTLGAAVGLTKLKSGARIVLTGGTHPGVKDFLALHRDEFASVERRSVNSGQIRSLAIADTQYRSRLGKAAEWLDLPHLRSIEIYDHHLDADSDIRATYTQIEAVGATTTLIVERLQQENVQLTTSEATVMALGIHADTGSLTFEQTTSRDAWALAWLMSQNASLAVIREYLEPGLSIELQQLLTAALENLVKQETQGYSLAWVLLESKKFVPGLSSLVERLLNLTEADALLVGHRYWRREEGKECLTVIGRSRIDGTDLQALFAALGGGGHPQAASVSLQDVAPEATLKQLVAQLEEQIPHPLTARDLMSSPVRTIRPQITIGEAQRILLRYGHSGLSVVDESDRLVGIISRRDLDIALHHGFAHAPVKGYMSRNLKTISPDTLLPEIEALMVTYDVGRLPVLADGELVGIVTRTDVLRQLHQDRTRISDRQRQEKVGVASCLLSSLQERLAAPFWQFLDRAAKEAQQRGWHLYLVGGGVRDLLLADRHEPLELPDIDTIVDGFYQAADAGAGVELAKALQKIYPQARLEVHGAFQTAALLWHKDPQLGSLAVDIATARTEFYPYPAANPEVEASSIRQDLYRRDFTINALAVRLTQPRAGEMLDFFGGLLDLRDRLIRVLHPNSFIEDPTRIYRAVRFAVRLGFKIETQTEEYIRYAISSGIYERSHSGSNFVPALTTRLKSELKYILQAPYWKPALQMLADLGALRCLHQTMKLDQQLWWQVRLSDRWLQRFDPDNTLTHWQMRLEVLIASLAADERAKVAKNLQLPLESIDRLENLAIWKSEIDRCLPNCQLKSEVVKLLRKYKLPALVLVGVKNSRSIRRTIWQYLTNWSEIKPPLNGNDLKALGYKPGPRYKQILDDLLSARLDDKISESRSEAIDFLTAHYPK
ncbi:MAG: CBS domain-containing protein [Oscillatoria sp. PMC 1051.18]|nr:CBS domain-containing protein [Oscillatoria sp. PMC 1050.18]MEC5030599.1 CBS domain-containing protein [Oscillatoria sp. PMC 1051.18]